MTPESGDRLRDGDPEFARLVSALRSAGPSRDALARTLSAVDGVASEPAAPASGTRPAKTAAIALGAGAVALVLAAAGYEWRGSKASAPEAPPSAVTSLVRDEAAPSEVPTASVRVEDLPPAPAAEPGSRVVTQARPIAGPKAPPPAAQVPASSTKGPAPSADVFLDELTLVERVRTQLSSGEHEACLRSIDEYSARFQRGAFVQEVEVMRIEALAASGARGRARVFGEKFLSEHPTSPYAGRVRSVLENSK